MMGTCMEEMGQLLKVVRCHRVGRQDCPLVVVDFDHAEPTESDEELYQITNKVLEQATALLQDIADYGSGASDAVRLAIAEPNDECVQKKCWDKLVPFIHRIHLYQKFSLSFQQIVPLLLWELCSGPLPPSEQLSSRQAITTQFARVLDFVLSFDELKMKTPALQNDFSFYRRSMSRRSLAFGLTLEEEAIIPVDEANVISLFYAQPTPMLSALIQAASTFVQEQPALPLSNTTDTVGTMANVCLSMAKDPDVARREETLYFCLRVMTAALIVYDYLSETGAFNKSSIVNTKQAIRLLKEERERDEGRGGSLLNCVRFHSKHLKDPSTPKEFRTLLGCPSS